MKNYRKAKKSEINCSCCRFSGTKEIEWWAKRLRCGFYSRTDFFAQSYPIGKNMTCDYAEKKP